MDWLVGVEGKATDKYHGFTKGTRLSLPCICTKAILSHAVGINTPVFCERYSLHRARNHKTDNSDATACFLRKYCHIELIRIRVVRPDARAVSFRWGSVRSLSHGLFGIGNWKLHAVFRYCCNITFRSLHQRTDQKDFVSLWRKSVLFGKYKKNWLAQGVYPQSVTIRLRPLIA